MKLERKKIKIKKIQEDFSSSKNTQVNESKKKN